MTVPAPGPTDADREKVAAIMRAAVTQRNSDALRDAIAAALAAEREVALAPVRRLIETAPVMWHGDYPVKAVPVAVLLDAIRAAAAPSPTRGGPDTAGVDPAEIVRQRALGWPDMHPEDFCHRCGRRNPCWFADAAEWQTATGSTGDGGGILCPSCFCALWEQVTGRTAIIWRLSIDPRSRDAAPADPAAGEAKLRDEVTREIAGWMAAPHEPEQWQIDNADDLAAALLTGPLAAVVERAAKYDEIETGIEAELGELREKSARVEALADELDGLASDAAEVGIDSMAGAYRGSAEMLRRALDGEVSG